MKLNKKIIVINLFVFAMALFIFAISDRGINKGATKKMLKTGMNKMDINNYILKNVNIPLIDIFDGLNTNISEMIFCNDIDENINILEYMKDGMENAAIVDYYQEDIYNVMTMTNSKMIEIRYYEVDLNDNGMKDLIVSFISPLHSGTQGDSFQILFCDGKHYFKNHISYTFKLYYQNRDYTPVGQVYILPNKTNGYHDLEIFTDETHFFLKYQKGAYHYIAID